MLRNCQIKVKTSDNVLSKMFVGLVETNYGQIVLGSTVEDDVLCIAYLHFSEGRSISHFMKDICKHFPDTECIENDEETQKSFKKYFLEKEPKLVYVILSGTEFQYKVWSELLKIPYGEECTYTDVANAMDCPKAVRAVANAVANNNIALFVPCHRVKAKNSEKLKYRWGGDTKLKILLEEKNKM